MVLSAGGFAGVVVTAGSYALLTPFLADEVGQGLRVFGSVRGLTVSADAIVRERSLLACQHACVYAVRVKGNLRHHRCLQRSLTTHPVAGGRAEGKLPPASRTISLFVMC